MEREALRELKESKVQLFSRLKPRNIFPGEWESVFTGEGVEFAAIEPLEPGDDLRDLDLHTLVQSGEEEIVHRVAARQIRVFVWVDVSGSMQRYEAMLFRRKLEIRDIAIGLLLFSACNVYSPVGLCAFDAGIRQFFPAKSGERYCWEILDWLVDHRPQHQTGVANMGHAISFMLQRALPRSLVFLVSDFQDAAVEAGFVDMLRPAATKFDLVPVVIRDPLEKEGALRHPVRIAVADHESGESGEIYLTPERLEEMQRASAGHLAHLESVFRELGIGHVVLDSASVGACHRTLSGFFQARTMSR
jgi:uncharacterized protein (DUF58 family)